MENKYLCKFDSQGYRHETYLSCEYSEEAKQDMMANGYVEITQEEWDYYVGNKGMGVNGTGYMRGADGKPTSAPPYEPSKAEKLASLEYQYEQDKAELVGYSNTALILDDAEEMAELREELAELETEYNEKRAEIEGE